MLCDWLNQPHMREFYQPVPITLEEITEHYAGRAEGVEPVFSHIAFTDGKPFGKIQCYKNDIDPALAAMGMTEGVGIDLFIGDPAFLGKGLGQAMMKSYLDNVVFRIFPDETRCYIVHAKGNPAALKCSKSVGFRFVRDVCDVTENGVLSEILVYDRT